MSWDVSLFDAPPSVRSVADLPDDFEPRAFARSELIAKILTAFSEADFSDPAWGRVEGDDWSIEVNFGEDETTHGPMLHVRGSRGAVEAVTKICAVLGLRGLDCSTSEFMDAQHDPGEGFQKWSAYRDQVVKSHQQPSLFERVRRFFRR